MQPAKAAHGAFLARRKLAASGSSRAPCAFPNLRCYPRCWLFSCSGLWSHPHISPKEHQKERCGHSRPQRSFITLSWCASDYSVVGRIYRRTSNCFCKDGIEFGYAVLKNTSPHNYALFMAARDLCDKTEAVTMADLAEPEVIDPEALRLIVNATLIARYGLAAFQIRARGAKYER